MTEKPLGPAATAEPPGDHGAAPSPLAGLAAGTPLIGREVPLARLVKGLDAAWAGRGWFNALVGEAGTLGKLHRHALDAHALAIAGHYRDGQVWDKAAEYFARAGARASALRASSEALACYGQAMAALTKVDDRIAAAGGVPARERDCPGRASPVLAQLTGREHLPIPRCAGSQARERQARTGA